MAAILIVEDDKNQRLLLQEELELEGYTTLPTACAREALDAVSRTMPDLVVLDIGMPGMDGLELLGKLMDLNNRLPVVIYTAYASYKDNFMSWAADAYLLKKSDLTELKRTIQDMLDRRPEPRFKYSPPPERARHVEN